MTTRPGGGSELLAVGLAPSGAPDLVAGRTPVALVVHRSPNRPRAIHLKLEGHNPEGSVKDRTAIALLEDLERRHALRASSVVVESSSGNLAIALARLCAERGYRFHSVVDKKITDRNARRLTELGAEVDMVLRTDVSGNSLEFRLDRVSELCRARRYVWTNQYGNPANPRAHYEGTGPEILQQLDGRVDAVFVPVSTGGTVAGIRRFFREASPQTEVVGVDAWGSMALGGSPGPRLLVGIGSTRPSQFVSPDDLDGSELVSDSEAFSYCLGLEQSTGLSVGGSSGAALAACIRWLSHRTDDPRVVVVCPDSGDRYADTIYSARWRASVRVDTYGCTFDSRVEVLATPPDWGSDVPTARAAYR